eukprot:COSAG01_NODE_821_length_13328_cov_2.385441_7_plen_258_part_00
MTKLLDGIAEALRSQPAPLPPPAPLAFAGQLKCAPSAHAAAGVDPSTPMDIKMGLTGPEDVAFPLRWGFLTAGRICADMAKAIHIAIQRGCGATLAAVAARSLEVCGDLGAAPRLSRCFDWGFSYATSGVGCRKGKNCDGPPGQDAEAFASEHGCAKAYGGDSAYADLCADPDIDICYVGTITKLHMEHALLAIRGGKHVLCEKPFAADCDELRTMYDAADNAGVLLQEGWDPSPSFVYSLCCTGAGEDNGIDQNEN